LTPEARKLILSLVRSPKNPAGGDPGAVLDYFGTHDGAALGRRLLRDAVEQKDATDLELAMIVCSRFDAYDESLLPLLADQAVAGWHQRHEDVVSRLGKYESPAAVDALYRATQWIPDYLDYDDSRALARKAIWALGGTPGPEAEQALTRLLEDKDEDLHELAAEQLLRHHEHDAPSGG
jgi:HEAT repeat protein